MVQKKIQSKRKKIKVRHSIKKKAKEHRRKEKRDKKKQIQAKKKKESPPGLWLMVAGEKAPPSETKSDNKEK
ncbi:hypothetical protein ADUPG1_009481 [Aduncisulcus paluster]|uniref:Uncharacterized protein n=1 Tax=Aduncisulcus paluster TaxID=2918883 RepID=A0ABQ5KVP6_9EUKA|nr:hypothetical protein ADUPG1_009481 [Aduncisulcus paluster]